MSSTTSELDPTQLLGATIGVTSHRRSDELIATFTRILAGLRATTAITSTET